MKTLMPCLCGCAVVFLMYGCGPMQMPMPVRLDANAQKNIDQTWDKALTPVGRFDHQGLLDFFLLTQAYQAGVDKLTFRSEKKVALGMVVMEIEYDRLKPDEDRFEAKLYDPAGNLLRQERYSRQEVEGSNRDLLVRTNDLENKIDDGHGTPAEVKELAALKARIDAVMAICSKEEKDAPRGNGKKN
jgi:hypothetical protein